MRGSYSGNTLAFQAKARSSILLPRSSFGVNAWEEGHPAVTRKSAKRRVGSNPTYSTKKLALIDGV